MLSLLLVVLLGWALAPAARAALPDGRAYELVSTADDLGNGVHTNTVQRIAPTGGHAFFTTTAPFAGSHSALGLNQYAADRTPNGWVQRTLTPFYPLNVIPPVARALLDYTPDYREAIFEEVAGNDWSADGGTGNSTYVVDSSPTFPRRMTPAGLGGYTQVGTSADLSHLVFATTDLLDPREQDPTTGRTGSNAIYETVDGGPPVLIGVDDAGNLVSRCGATIAGTSQEGLTEAQYEEPKNPVSDDGEVIYFATFQGCEGEPEAGQLYARIGQERTVMISASRRSTPDTTRIVPTFLRATLDGSRAFFRSSELLTDAEPAESNGPRLYSFDLPTAASPAGVLTDLTPAAVDENGDPTTESPGVEAVLDISRDGSTVFFTATGRLTPEAVPGEVNLYVSHQGAVSLVATTEVPNSNGGNFSTADTTSSGGKFAFFSAANLPGTVAQGGAMKVYLYDTATKAVVCASCRADGAESTGNISVPDDSVGQSGRHRVNFVTESGQVFFSSTQSLVDVDTNGVRDVYGYVPGEGPRLISAGTSPLDSLFAGVTDDGVEAAFVTASSLTWEDTDAGSRDLYVARVGGGFEQPGDPDACTGDACQAPTPPAPAAAAPGSAAVIGVGSPNARAAARCGKYAQLAQRKLKLAKSAAPKRAQALRKQGHRLRAKAADCRASLAAPARRGASR